MRYVKIKSIVKQNKEIIAIIISLLDLGLIVALTFRGNFLEKKSNSLQAFSNELLEQANVIQEQIIDIEKNVTDLQYEIHKITNFNTTIYGGENFIYLESIHFQYLDKGTINYIILRGNLSTTINIITPHYGRAEIIITNFTRTKEIYKNGMEKYTEVSFVRQPQYLYTYQGLNTFKLDIPLTCIIHPIFYLVPLPGQSEGPFIIGDLYFQIRFYDMQSIKTVTYEFDAEVQGIIEAPIS